MQVANDAILHLQQLFGTWLQDAGGFYDDSPDDDFGVYAKDVEADPDVEGKYHFIMSDGTIYTVFFRQDPKGRDDIVITSDERDGEYADFYLHLTHDDLDGLELREEEEDFAQEADEPPNPIDSKPFRLPGELDDSETLDLGLPSDLSMGIHGKPILPDYDRKSDKGSHRFHPATVIEGRFNRQEFAVTATIPKDYAEELGKSGRKQYNKQFSNLYNKINLFFEVLEGRIYEHYDVDELSDDEIKTHEAAYLSNKPQAHLGKPAAKEPVQSQGEDIKLDEERLIRLLKGIPFDGLGD